MKIPTQEQTRVRYVEDALLTVSRDMRQLERALGLPPGSTADQRALLRSAARDIEAIVDSVPGARHVLFQDASRGPGGYVLIEKILKPEELNAHVIAEVWAEGEKTVDQIAAAAAVDGLSISPEQRRLDIAERVLDQLKGRGIIGE